MTVKEPKVHTLEDVAEGVLNGIFCTYEPPDPRRMGHQPSILRGTNQQHQHRHHHRNATRHIRWKDEKPLTPKILNWNDTVQRACVDASKELGFTPKMDTETALAKARSKTPRTQTNLVFDSEGFPAYRDEKLAAKEPPPVSLPEVPPPSRRELFLPQLCGIPLGCGEDSSLQDTSLVDEFRYEQQQPMINHRPTERLVDGKVVPIVEEYISSSDEEAGDDWASGSMHSNSSLLYRVFAYRKKKDAFKMATFQEDDSHDSGIAKSRQKRGRMKIKRLVKRRGSKSSDWDESVPVVPLEMRSTSKVESRHRRRKQGAPKRRSRSVSPRRRSRSTSPGQKSSDRHPSLVRRRSKSPVPRPFPRRSSGDSSSQQRGAAFYHQHHLPFDQSDRQSHIGAFREGYMNGAPAWNDVTQNQRQPNAYSQDLLPNDCDPYPSQFDSAKHHRSTRRRSKSPMRPRGKDHSQAPPQGHSQYPDSSVPRYFDPTNPRAFAVSAPGPVQNHVQGHQRSQANPEEVNPPTTVAANNEEGSALSWEDRTRLAWDQIRSGVAALTLEAKQNAEKEKTKASDPQLGQHIMHPNPMSYPPPMMQSPSFPRDQDEYHARKVRFGEPQKLVYYDTMDENHSDRSYSTKGSNRSRKTKRRLRGTKLIGGALARMKKKINKRRSSPEANDDSVSADNENVPQVHTWGSDPIERDRRREDSFDQSEPSLERLDDHHHLFSSDYEDSKTRNQNPLSAKN